LQTPSFNGADCVVGRPNPVQKQAKNFAKIACEKFHDAATSRPLPAGQAGSKEGTKVQNSSFSRQK